MRTLLFRFLAGALAALAMAAPAGSAERDNADTIPYRVLKGDNLYTLAARYFSRTSSYSVVQRLNRIADPRRLRIGTTLLIPRTLLRQEPVRAVVHSYRGSVRIEKRGKHMPAAIGMIITEGDLVETGGKSSISLRLSDGTTVTLPSQTRVRVERLRRTLLAGTVDRSFSLEQGRASATVKPMEDPRSNFQLSTPVAVSAVRGTSLRMRYDPATHRATSEVLEGKVQFSAEGGAMRMVPAGFGTASHLERTLPLLAAPALIDTGRVQNDEQLRFAIQPLAGASRYRLQIAKDAGFLELLDEAETAANEAQFPAIPNGDYFVRVTGIDHNALEGLPATYGFTRRLNRITVTAEEERVGRYHQYLFRWRTPDARNAQYRFQLSADPGGTSPIVDEPGLLKPSFVITDLPPGIYFWRVQIIEVEDGKISEKWTSANELRVDKAR